MPGQKEGTDRGGDVCLMLFPFPSLGQGSNPLGRGVRPGVWLFQEMLHCCEGAQVISRAETGPSGLIGPLTGRAPGTGSGGGGPHRRPGGVGSPQRGQCGWLRVDGGTSVCPPPLDAHR